MRTRDLLASHTPPVTVCPGALVVEVSNFAAATLGACSVERGRPVCAEVTRKAASMRVDANTLARGGQGVCAGSGMFVAGVRSRRAIVRKTEVRRRLPAP